MGITMKHRAISEMVAILIVITIMVGIAIAVALMSGAFVQRIRPSGGGLVITGASARKVSDNRVVVTISLQNVGSEAIDIKSVLVYNEGGSQMTIQPASITASLPTGIQPNQVVTLGFSVMGTVTDYSKIYVIISYSTVTGVTGYVSQSIVVLPS